MIVPRPEHRCPRRRPGSAPGAPLLSRDGTRTRRLGAIAYDPRTVQRHCWDTYRGESMTRVIGYLGVTNIRTFIYPQNPKRVAVSMDVADMDALMAVRQSPQGAEAMDYDGVVADTLVILVEA